MRMVRDSLEVCVPEDLADDPVIVRAENSLHKRVPAASGVE
jgi:hypothetical protein